MNATAHSTRPSAAASAHAPASRPLELLEARQLRDSLKLLLREEQAAMADFLVALADFDRRSGWEPLGHANLFAFIRSELGLSPAPTYLRQEAARLLERFPELEGPLRHGKLCLTTMAELAKVLTIENWESVLPRFLGISTREAKEIVAELQPRQAPATLCRFVGSPATTRPDRGPSFATLGAQSGFRGSRWLGRQARRGRAPLRRPEPHPRQRQSAIHEDAGGVCGSMHRLELDHVVPWAKWSEPTVANLRVVCRAHNRLAARREFGRRCVKRYTS
jgi:hypothetical protein